VNVRHDSIASLFQGLPAAGKQACGFFLFLTNYFSGGVEMFKRILILFLVLAFTPAVLAAEQITLNYANFPPASTFPCVQMERYKAEVEKRTNGQVQINTYPGGTLLGAKNMFRVIINGQADIGCLCMSYQPGVFPLTTAVELPVGFKSSRQASLVLWDLYQKYEPREFSRVKVLTMFATAPSNLMTSKPVKNLADIKGMQIRASGAASSVLELLGATPVSMPMSETPEAPQKGMVKGVFSSLEVLQDLNFAAYCPYQTRLDLQVYPFAVVMNRDKWESLPPKVREVMDELGREQAEWTGEYMDGHVENALDYAREKYGTEMFSLSPSQRELMFEKVEPLIGEWKEEAKKRDLEAEKILEDVYELRDKYAGR
jgi:TRAP-type C4-dicarboxylate transport system substrate-binding protein